MSRTILSLCSHRCVMSCGGSPTTFVTRSSPFFLRIVLLSDGRPGRLLAAGRSAADLAVSQASAPPCAGLQAIRPILSSPPGSTTSRGVLHVPAASRHDAVRRPEELNPGPRPHATKPAAQARQVRHHPMTTPATAPRRSSPPWKGWRVRPSGGEAPRHPIIPDGRSTSRPPPWTFACPGPRATPLAPAMRLSRLVHATTLPLLERRMRRAWAGTARQRRPPRQGQDPGARHPLRPRARAGGEPPAASQSRKSDPIRSTPTATSSTTSRTPSGTAGIGGRVQRRDPVLPEDTTSQSDPRCRWDLTRPLCCSTTWWTSPATTVTSCTLGVAAWIMETFHA